MRVFHLRNSHLIGGPERLLLDQGRRAAPGHEGTLASFALPHGDNPLLHAAGEAGFDTREVDQSSSFDPRIVRRVRRLLREQPYDIVVGHDYKANVVLALAARGLGVPRVAIVHGYTAENTKVAVLEAIDRRLLKGADAVVAVSRASMRELARAGVAPERLHLVPNCVDVARVEQAARGGREPLRAEWSCGANDVVLMTVGRFSREKNQRLLVEVFGELGGAARLMLLGDGPARSELDEAVRRAGVAARARVVGWRDDATRCLGAADIFVLPSLREGVPVALLEAMAAGLPVVASRVGGVPDLLGDGRFGLLVPPGDAGALRSALESLLRDPDRRAALGEAGRGRVREAYDAGVQARELERLYEAVVASRQPPA